jgi:predicted amidohydrolase YtcJ
MRRTPVFVAILGVELLAQQPHVDRLFVNARVWTGELSKPFAQAIAIGGDKIIAVGNNNEVRRLASANTAVQDLGGRLVTPGFTDAHWHFVPRGSAELTGAANVAEIQNKIREHAKRSPTAWITGSGWVYTMFPHNAPHRNYLDEIFPSRPVLIHDRDHHQALANTEALRRGKITRETPDPPNGSIVKDSNGEPTGELKEGAVQLVASLLPTPSPEQRYDGLKALMQEAASYGLTSLHVTSSAGLSNTMDQALFERAATEGLLKQRLYVAVPFDKDKTAEEMVRFKDLRRRYPGPLLKFGSAKGMLDGTIDGRTAAMLEPYVGGGTGTPNYSQAELNTAVARYDSEGFQIMLHAIGDRAIRMALDAYENAAKLNGTSGRRHRVEHIEVPHPRDLPRFSRLGVIASTQATFAEPDESFLKNYARLLGPERTRRAMPFQKLDEAGAVQPFGSDFPVFSMEVLRGIYIATTRMTPAGYPPGGWSPENRISVEAALRHFTHDAAYASFDENVKGTITPGKLADFVVLSNNILETKKPELLKTVVLLTVMGGRDTYRAKGF